MIAIMCHAQMLPSLRAWTACMKAVLLLRTQDAACKAGPIMENQMEKKMENEMETGVI